MKSLCALSGFALLLASCSTVSETGRSRIAWFPEGYVNELGASAYTQATSEYRVITGTPEAEMVQRMGRRIAAAAAEAGYEYDWEFKLLDAPDTVNAFALPGGKVAIYTGILPLTQNEGGLAAVVGHEIAHVTAEHGNERMTQGLITDVGLSVAGAALESWTDMSPAARDEVVGYLGGAGKIGVLLPFSREHESEADEIGLRFLIRAGYDPYEAPKLWDRMAEMAGPDRGPEWLSTHPDPAQRAARLRELIPQMLEQERGRGGT